MSTGSAPGVNETTASQLQAYIQNLPQLLNVTAAQTGPVGQQVQNAANQLAPQQQQLQSQLFGQYAPELYNIGNQLNQQQTQAGVNQASNILQNGGGALAQQVQNLDQQLNPQYYQTRQAEGNQLSNLLGSINLGGLTSNESRQVQQSNAQQDAQRGILNSPSQTATVSNAMNYGSALQQKQANLAGAIQSATNFLQPSQSGISAFNIGTGAATTQANPGATQFLGTQNATSSTTGANNQLAGQLLGGINTSANNAAQITGEAQRGGSATSILGALPSF